VKEGRKVVNGYTIVACGGFVTPKRWEVYDEDKRFVAVFFKYKEAKEACLRQDFPEQSRSRLIF